MTSYCKLKWEQSCKKSRFSFLKYLWGVFVCTVHASLNRQSWMHSTFSLAGVIAQPAHIWTCNCMQQIPVDLQENVVDEVSCGEQKKKTRLEEWWLTMKLHNSTMLHYTECIFLLVSFNAWICLSDKWTILYILLYLIWILGSLLNYG